jgi:CRISPR-associated Cas5-like protein
LPSHLGDWCPQFWQKKLVLILFTKRPVQLGMYRFRAGSTIGFFSSLVNMKPCKKELQVVAKYWFFHKTACLRAKEILTYCSFRKGSAREYLETEEVPPPTTVYGFLLSLVGKEERLAYAGTGLAYAVLS